MKNFGILCPPAFGHINPMIILGKEIMKQGHSVSFFTIIDLKEKIIKEGFDFHTIGYANYPLGSMNKLLNEKLSQCNEYDMMLYWNEFCLELANNTTDELVKAIKESNIDFLLVDQMDITGGSVAQYLGIPFVTIINSLPTNYEDNIPPPFTNLSYNKTESSKAINKFTFSRIKSYYSPILNKLNDLRKSWNLDFFEAKNNIFFSSEIAQISQIPKAFDFPREELGKHFHYLAPFRDQNENEILEFPPHLLDGRPVVYASLGTLCNGHKDIFMKIATAIQKFDLQLVLYVGTQDVSLFKDLPGNPLIMNHVPQFELLKITSLIISHCGANTILDAISNAVPIVAIPISLDQPSIAERIRHHKIGEVVSFKHISVEKLEEAIELVLFDKTYKENIISMKNEISKINGTKQACEIILEIAEFEKVETEQLEYA